MNVRVMTGAHLRNWEQLKGIRGSSSLIMVIHKKDYVSGDVGDEGGEGHGSAARRQQVTTVSSVSSDDKYL